MKSHHLKRVTFPALALACASALGVQVDHGPPVSLTQDQIDKYRRDSFIVTQAIKANAKILESKAKPIPKSTPIQKDIVDGWIKFQEWSVMGGHSLEKAFYNYNSRKNLSLYPVEIISCFNKQFIAASDANAQSGEVAASQTSLLQSEIDAQPKKSPWSWSWEFRQSFADVLTAEDPSQSAGPTDSLKGGLISYTRNFNGGLDTWSAQAALMFPIIYKAPDVKFDPNAKPSSSVTLISAGFIPGVSIFRVTGAQNLPNNTTVKDVDQLTFRLGVFQKYFITAGPVQTLTLREAFLETTDTGFRLNAPSGLVELEPQVSFSKYFQLGSLTTLIPKPKRDPDDPCEKRTTYLSYQLRVLLHAEYGSILSSGSTPVVTGDFCRVGPVTELTFTPVFFKPLSLVAGYQYLSTFEGDNTHNSLFTSSAEWKFFDSSDTADQKAKPADGSAENGGNQNQKRNLSLKLTYTNGGIDITKQRVNTLLIGLGGTY